MQILSLLIAGVLASAVSSYAYAAPFKGKKIELPVIAAELPFSDLSGSQLATQKCVICHSVDYIRFQPPKMDQKQWTGEVAKMKYIYGATLLTDTDIKAIGAYLAVVYGTAKETDSAVIEASKIAISKSKEIDLQALLNEHGCSACHAIEKKIVGPSFKEVAARYKQDKHTSNRLIKSLNQGSTGQWGNVPMPAIQGLSDAEAKALAEFVLQQ